MSEKLVTAIAIPIIQVVHVRGLKENDTIKGHCFGIKLQRHDVIKDIAKVLPRTDIDLKMQLVIHGTHLILIQLQFNIMIVINGLILMEFNGIP